MNRERTAWLLSFVLLAIAAFRNPTAAQRDSDYRFVGTLVDIQRKVLDNYVDKVDDSKLEQGAISGMLNTLDDPFTIYIPPATRESFDRALEGTFEGVGIELNQLPTGEIEVATPIDGSPAFKAGVKAGDIIVKVNGQVIHGLNREEVRKLIVGKVNSEVLLTVKRVTGEVADLKMQRQNIVLPTVKGYERKADDSWEFYVSRNPKIAYLRLTQFTPTTFDSVKEIMQALLKDGMKGLILDLRWNPGGQLDQAVQVVDLFISEGIIVRTKGRNRPEEIRRAIGPGTLPNFPMIVLVNEQSASAAEIVAGSLMDNHRAVVLGERTYGKGSVQELVPLDGNSGELKLTVAYYYLPSGRLVHKKKGATDWGVEPQIKVPMDQAAQMKVADVLAERERFRRPTTGPSNEDPAATTQPVVDIQLQRAVEMLKVMSVLQSAPNPAVVATTPTTRAAE